MELKVLYMFIFIYGAITILMYNWLNYIISSFIENGDNEMKEVFNKKSVRVFTTSVISLLWIIFLPIMINNTVKENY